MLRSLFFCASLLAFGDTPPDVLEFFRTVASALVNAHSDDPCVPSDAGAFLENFDRRMTGYAKLRDEIEALVAKGHVGSAIEIVSDDGDEQARSLELDWLLEIEGQPSRRKILKCRIEKQGKAWKIVGLEPVEFFGK